MRTKNEVIENELTVTGNQWELTLAMGDKWCQVNIDFDTDNNFHDEEEARKTLPDAMPSWVHEADNYEEAIDECITLLNIYNKIN